MLQPIGRARATIPPFPCHFRGFVLADKRSRRLANCNEGDDGLRPQGRTVWYGIRMSLTVGGL
jgi:hypothetical protein